MGDLAQLGSDHFQMLPSEDFMGLDDYIESGTRGWDAELRDRVNTCQHGRLAG